MSFFVTKTKELKVEQMKFDSVVIAVLMENSLLMMISSWKKNIEPFGL